MAVRRNIVQSSSSEEETDRGFLKSGDGGTFDSMEACVKVLEDMTQSIGSKLGKLIERFGKIEVDLAYLKGKIDMLPTTLHLPGFILAVLGITGLTRYFTG